MCDVKELTAKLKAAEETVELQRFKLDRQAEDLHQSKSLESIHRDKRYEVEREFNSYKHDAETNSYRLAGEVCRLEDELEAAQSRIAELEARTVTVKLPESLMPAQHGSGELFMSPDDATPENVQILASTYAPRGITYQWDRDECNAAADSWNACRAAMLNAEPVSQPYTLPQWIPCSERMPEESGRYWCYVEEQNDLGKSHYQWNCSWNGDVWSDKALTGRVTHWMPLPAAPQEPTK